MCEREVVKGRREKGELETKGGKRGRGVEGRKEEEKRETTKLEASRKEKWWRDKWSQTSKMKNPAKRFLCAPPQHEQAQHLRSSGLPDHDSICNKKKGGKKNYVKVYWGKLGNIGLSSSSWRPSSPQDRSLQGSCLRWRTGYS